MDTHELSDADVRRAAGTLVPELTEQVVRLARIPSIAAAGFPEEPLFEAHREVAELVRSCGVTELGRLEVPGTTAPILTATLPGPRGAPTVLLYTHYDVVPAGDLSLWHTEPFEPVVADGAIYGRGVADSKANIVAIVGALKLLRDRMPVTVKLILEGHEEFGSPFDDYPPQAPEEFAADAMVIADVGSVRPGSPTLTVALRGSATVTVTVRSLAGDKHSGQYGGAAPDARLALIRALASLHDDAGDVVVAGLRRVPWEGATYTEAEFRELAEIVDGVPLQGTGTIGERIWSGPAITVIGFDAPPTAAPLNSVASSAKATLNLRIHPEQDAAEAQAALVAHLRAQHPFGLKVDVVPGAIGNGFAAPLGGPAYDAAMNALSTAWGAPAELMAGGGSIPVVMAMHHAVPTAEKLLFGATDGYSHIHAPNERVLIDEIEKAVIAMTIFLRDFGAAGSTESA